MTPDRISRKCSSVQWSPHTAMEFSNNELKTGAQSYFRAQLKANYELWIANDSQCGALILLIWNFVFIQICPFFKDLQDMQIKIHFFGLYWKHKWLCVEIGKHSQINDCQLDLQIFKLQRVPALRTFWDLEKTMLHEIRVNGTVGGSQLMQKSPTCTYICKKPWQWKPC